MGVPLQLEPVEARVLGVLVEKELTTPEQYPLTLNALVAGCNQKSNRDPVLSLTDSEVNQAILRLRIAGLVDFVQPATGRVERYAHRASGRFGLERAGIALLAELLLRGAQAPGELRSRAERMAPIADPAALDAALAPLVEKGLAEKLPPPLGSRAPLWRQLLAPDSHPLPASEPVRADALPVPTLTARVAELEAEVARLRGQLESLAQKLGEPLAG